VNIERIIKKEVDTVSGDGGHGRAEQIERNNNKEKRDVNYPPLRIHMKRG